MWKQNHVLAVEVTEMEQRTHPPMVSGAVLSGHTRVIPYHF